MADNTQLNAGTGGDLIAADDVATGVAAGAKVQRVKAGHGADGTFFDPSPATPFPVQDEQVAHALGMLLSLLGMAANQAGQLRAIMDATSNLGTVTTVTTVTTVAAVTTVNAFGGALTLDQFYAGQAHEQALRSRITTT